MTNSIALVLALVVFGMLVLDATMLHWGVPLLLARQTASLIEWLSFWR